jgi:hypothetical protein
MYKVEHHVGRLVEAKLASPLTMEEVQQFARSHMAIMAKINGKYVGVVDLLEAHVSPSNVAETLIQMLSGAATHVERSALLIGESATFALQVERVLRSGNNPNRRAFRRVEELVHWLSEVLTVPERVRLDRFVHEMTAKPAVK